MRKHFSECAYLLKCLRVLMNVSARTYFNRFHKERSCAQTNLDTAPLKYKFNPWSLLNLDGDASALKPLR